MSRLCSSVRWIGGEAGQAAVFLLIAVGMVMAFACGLYITSSYLVAKIRAQNAADAAAVAGAGAIADCLDALVVNNWLQWGFLAAGSVGETVRSGLDAATSSIARFGGVFAAARVMEIGAKNGAVAFPINAPHLEVNTWGDSWLSFLFPRLTIYRDRLSRGQIGRRFVRATAAVSPQIPHWVSAPFRANSAMSVLPPTGAAAEASVSGNGLTYLHFQGVLGKVRSSVQELIQANSGL